MVILLLISECPPYFLGHGGWAHIEKEGKLFMRDKLKVVFVGGVDDDNDDNNDYDTDNQNRGSPDDVDNVRNSLVFKKNKNKNV